MHRLQHFTFTLQKAVCNFHHCGIRVGNIPSRDDNCHCVVLEPSSELDGEKDEGSSGRSRLSHFAVTEHVRLVRDRLRKIDDGLNVSFTWWLVAGEPTCNRIAVYVVEEESQSVLDGAEAGHVLRRPSWTDAVTEGDEMREGVLFSERNLSLIASEDRDFCVLRRHAQGFAAEERSSNSVDSVFWNSGCRLQP